MYLYSAFPNIFNRPVTNEMKKQIKCIIIVYCCSVFCNIQQAISQTISYYQTGEEFSGPLPSWKNVKTDFGAKGDGVTDDAPAITAALYTFKDMNTTDKGQRNSSFGE